MEKKLNPELYIKDLEARVTELVQEIKSFKKKNWYLHTLLEELVTNIEQEVGRTEGTRQLWETVDEIDDELSGATRDYVNQD
jgi:uncharacterized coiled-coil DUF342 family protein